MPKLVGSLVIDHERKQISVDGEEFPFYVALEEISVSDAPESHVSTVYLPVFAENIEIRRK